MKAKFVPKTERVLQSKKRRRNFWFEINGWNICRESEQQFPEILERKSFHCLFHRRHFTFFLPFWELFFSSFLWELSVPMKEKCPTCFLVFREKNLKRIVPVKTKTDIFALEIINYIFFPNTDNIVLLFNYSVFIFF